MPNSDNTVACMLLGNSRPAVRSRRDRYAIGDAALHVNKYSRDAHVRVESVQNANGQAAVAAKHICGQEVAYEALPWFWSNQYNLKLQTAGLSSGHDEAILRGDPAAGSFSVVYRRDVRVIAIDSVNSTKDFVQARALVLGSTRCESAALADSSIPLKLLC